MLARDPLRLQAGISFALAATWLAPGCAKNLGIPDAQLMNQRMAQCHTLAIPPEEAWQAVRSDVKRHANRNILVEDSKSRVLSWAEPIHLLASADKRGVSVTTIWVEDAGPESDIHIRQVYYGRKTHSGVSHSFGSYERGVAAILRQRYEPAQHESRMKQKEATHEED